MQQALKTTRPVRTVRSIDDIVAIESQPYDELVTARNLYDLFRATAQQVPDGPALTVLRSEHPEDVGTALTHRELLGEITRAANLFHALGITPRGGVAAFLVPTQPQLPALLLGAQVAGVASTLNYLLNIDALADLLDAQRASVLVIPDATLDETCWSKAQALFGRVASLRHVLVIGRVQTSGHIGIDEALHAHRADALDFEPSADRNAVCALFHTGGTTGRPKLVQLTHGNQIHAAFAFAQVFGYDERDVIVNGFPFFHVGGTITAGLSVLSAGGHVVVPSPYALRPPAVVKNYWNLVQRFRATTVSGVPTSIAALTNAWQPGVDVSHVRMAVTGGAVLPKAIGSRFEAVTGIRLFETYGMTESAAAIAFNPGRGAPLAGSVGFRAPYSEMRVVAQDASRADVCAANESGLVQVRGPQVFPGYLDPAQNTGTLSADGWLSTGDVGYITEDQRLVLTGREKDLIVRSGHNIDPAAIEDVANQFDGVQISAAVAMPDEYAGEVPALFVVPQPGAAIDLAALRHHLEANMHERPALPRSVMLLEALPVTAVGKIFKPALRDLAIEEKVRLEVARICGAAASARVEVRLDARKHTLVDVAVQGASDAHVEALKLALQPLPQSYTVTCAVTNAVTLEFRDGIATLTLNRPERLNAMSRELMASLAAKFDALTKRDGLRVVLITGAGRAFSAGGDLIEFETTLRDDPARLLADLRFNQQVMGRIEALPVPVIGVANGLAVAGGLELLLCCDLILAAEGARIGDGHARYGVVPAGGATVRLRERLSPSRAAQLFYTAGLVDAQTLCTWGVVNEVLPSERLMERALALAQEITHCSPEAVAHIKALMTTPTTIDRDQRFEAELERFAAHVAGRDLARGLAAFRNRQPPAY